jgi:hypothetical protein
VPDPTPARRLREGLEQARQRGESFPQAWERCVANAVDGLPPREASTWLLAWDSLPIRRQWQYAYVKVGYRLRLDSSLIAEDAYERPDLRVLA